MNAQGQTICLNMIVKDEAHVIRRCLDSVRPLIDAWVIADTGSTDGTQNLIRELLSDIPGTLFERPWVSFAHNRNEALEASRGRCDYTLLVDADNVLDVDVGFVLPLLDADAYKIQIRSDTLSYYRSQLVRSALPWRYVGVTHEYIWCDLERTSVSLSGVRLLHFHDGARAQDLRKYQRDVSLLEQGLLDEPENSRYVFYLAQSYRDIDEPELSLKNYRRRATMGGWCDEVWYSLYQIARLESRRSTPWSEVLVAYLAAVQYLPDRVEPLYWIAMHYQAAKEFHVAQGFFEWGLTCPGPGATNLFVEQAIYDYLLELEYAVCCYYTGEHVRSIEINDRLLARGNLPDHLIDLVAKNRQWGLKALATTKEESHDDSYSPRTPAMYPQLH
jgi:glycosyltransferase involved in cell wall biosynthesis